MRKIGLEELKSLQLDILDKVDKFCRENNLKYTLFYGTLLGAIRHQGYIPWDDDIDIAMPRPYYDKFLNTFNGTYNALHVLAPEIDPNYYAPYANVCDKRTLLLEGRNGHRSIEVGVKIDVFPVDSIPREEDSYIKLKNEIRRINGILSCKRAEVPPIKKLSDFKVLVKKMIYSNIAYDDLQRIIMTKVKSNAYFESEQVDCLVFQISDVRLKREDYEQYIDVPFERLKLMSIQNYDEYLRKLYGDYMQLPPENQRIPHHGFKAYWKD